MINEMKGDKLPLTCGIPIIKFVNFTHALLCVRALSLLIKVWMIRYHFTKRLHFELFRIMTVDLATVLCLMYGQTLLISKENDCSKE
jgi:hypothetical protein